MSSQWLPGHPFKLEIGAGDLDDLHERLLRARLPAQQAGPDWATGTPLSYMRDLRNYWLTQFDWRGWEERINRFDQCMVDIDGTHIHLLAERGSGPSPVPLVLTHGWPGSFIEFLDVIEPLAHPERFGGLVDDAFTVIVPSLPGYGFSPAPDTPIMPDDIATLWAKLMHEVFGFERYCAYGSDWGSLITAILAQRQASGLAGILLTTAGGFPAPDANIVASDEECAWIDLTARRMQRESAYQALQGTKPQSLAYGHTDSPLGLAAWIAEKFQAWTRFESGNPPPITMDQILANTMCYWLNGVLAPMWLYMGLGSLKSFDASEKPSVPAGFLLAPDDCFPPAPRSWVERFWHVEQYRVAGVGHFPGFDSPSTLVEELRKMHRWMRH